MKAVLCKFPGDSLRVLGRVTLRVFPGAPKAARRIATRQRDNGESATGKVRLPVTADHYQSLPVTFGYRPDQAGTRGPSDSKAPALHQSFVTAFKLPANRRHRSVGVA